MTIFQEIESIQSRIRTLNNTPAHPLVEQELKDQRKVLTCLLDTAEAQWKNRHNVSAA